MYPNGNHFRKWSGYLLHCPNQGVILNSFFFLISLIPSVSNSIDFGFKYIYNFMFLKNTWAQILHVWPWDSQSNKTNEKILGRYSDGKDGTLWALCRHGMVHIILNLSECCSFVSSQRTSFHILLPTYSVKIHTHLLGIHYSYCPPHLSHQLNGMHISKPENNNLCITCRSMCGR